MISILTWTARALIALLLSAAGIWFLGPRERVDSEISFNSNAIGSDVDSYLATQEAAFGDITPGAEKRVIWAGAPNTRTNWVVLYLHGFSATSEEIRPVPDNVAKALGANLVFARLSGHGRGSAAMAEPSAGDWIEDLAEALAIARAAGERTLVISMSTGGTLSAIAATDAVLSQQVAGIVFMSPNFRLNSRAAFILTWPGVRWWGPIFAGTEQRFQVLNKNHETFWTTRYPTVAIFPMTALVAYAVELDYSDVRIPALFLYNDHDMVVSPRMIRRMADRWGGPVTLEAQELPPGSDPYYHVLAGDALSPGMTDRVTTTILELAEGI